MSNKIIKWGFIGCGEVTKYKSGPAFQKVEGSKVVAVMSRDGKKAKAYAKERNIPKWYDDAQELIDDPEVNAVYIATPPFTRHLCHHVHESRKTGLYRKANGTDLRRVCPHQPHLTRDGSPLFCSLLPALPALLYESEGTGGQRYDRQCNQRTDPFCTAPSRSGL